MILFRTRNHPSNPQQPCVSHQLDDVKVLSINQHHGAPVGQLSKEKNMGWLDHGGNSAFCDWKYIGRVSDVAVDVQSHFISCYSTGNHMSMFYCRQMITNLTCCPITSLETLRQEPWSPLKHMRGRFFGGELAMCLFYHVLPMFLQSGVCVFVFLPRWNGTQWVCFCFFHTIRNPTPIETLPDGVQRRGEGMKIDGADCKGRHIQIKWGFTSQDFTM